MAKLPVRIVADGTNVSGGLGHRSLGPGGALILEADYGIANISGGVIPMTQAEFAAAVGDQVVKDLTPVAWFKYNQGITVTGAGVSQWDDQSGNGNHLKQGTDTNRPSKEADGSILFDGVDNYLKCDAFTLNQPATIYLLAKQVTWTSTDYLFDGNASTTGALTQRVGTPTVQLQAVSLASDNANWAVDTYAAVACVFNDTASIIQVNATTATSGNTGNEALGGFALGARADGAAPGNLQAKEAIVFAAAHDAGQRAAVIAYLMQLGGL